MRKIASYIIYTILVACIACACSSDLDIKQDYAFEVTCLPVPKKLKVGQTAEMRMQVVRQGNFSGTQYRMRFFLFDGRGTLAFADGIPLLPNDEYRLDQESFRMYYTSLSQERQSFTLYFSDNMGNSRSMEFSFNADSSQEDTP
jgi:hypothetical protein